jgi:DNA-binding response OmpR family regulator
MILTRTTYRPRNGPTVSTQRLEHQNATAKGNGAEEGKKKSILIYSPDLNFCFSLSMLFQDRYNVSTTTNINMIETFVANYSADLLIVDAMPSTRMIERLEGLKKLKALLPVIMLYVYNAKETDLDNAARHRVDSVFYKPFEVNSVSKRIEELLSK